MKENDSPNGSTATSKAMVDVRVRRARRANDDE